VLLAAALVVGPESELLVSALNPALETLRISPILVGLILIAIIGNAAEHASAVFFAMRDKIDVTLEIAVGSSTQVALLRRAGGGFHQPPHGPADGLRLLRFRDRCRVLRHLDHRRDLA